MRNRSLPLLVGVAAVLVGAAFSWVPSLWWDETATLSAANRPVGDMLDLHSRIDAVHALHNLLLHGWFSLVGVGEFTARIPGAVALGIGAAAVTATGQLLAGRHAALAVGILFVLTPRVTWAATEARSYAFAVAFAAVLSLLVAAGLTTRRARWWVLYALVLPVATTMFVYTATVAVAHAVTVLVIGRERVRFAVAAVVGGALSVPFVLLAYSQMDQVGWIPPLDGTVVRTVLLDQWFPQAPGAAVLCAIVAVAGSIVAVRRGVRPGERTLLWLALPGFTVPIVLLIGGSLLSGSNMFLERYASFTVSAMTLFVGWALTRVAMRGWTTGAVLVAFAVAVTPAYVQQRQPFGKAGGTDHSAVADLLEERSRPGDCVAFEPHASWQPTSLRSIADALPAILDGLDDVGSGRSAEARGNLWSSDAPPHTLAMRAARRCDVLWVVADGERDTFTQVWHPNDVWWRFEPHHFADTDTGRELAAAGFVVVDREPVHRMQLIRLEKTQTQ